jgi:hypothetical protein
MNITVTFGSEQAARTFVRHASSKEAYMLVDSKRVYVVTTREHTRFIYGAAKSLGGWMIIRTPFSTGEEVIPTGWINPDDD